MALIIFVSVSPMRENLRELRENFTHKIRSLVAFKRMDGAWLGSIDIAMKKAKTAVFFDMPCGDLGTKSQPGGSLYGIEHSNQGLITFPGNFF